MARHGEATSDPRSAPDPTRPTDAELAVFAASARLEAAVGARRREHWLRQQAGEDISLQGTCWSLAEGERAVLVTTRSGTSHRGVLRVVGEDFVTVEDGARRQHLVPLAAIATLSAESPGRSSADVPAGRPCRSGARFAEALASLAGDRPLVSLRCDGPGPALRGELLGAGAEVVVVAADGGRDHHRHRRVYVRLSSVAEVSLMASG